jgi:hypothetical protein
MTSGAIGEGMLLYLPIIQNLKSIERYYCGRVSYFCALFSRTTAIGNACAMNQDECIVPDGLLSCKRRIDEGSVESRRGTKTGDRFLFGTDDTYFSRKIPPMTPSVAFQE